MPQGQGQTVPDDPAAAEGTRLRARIAELEAALASEREKHEWTAGEQPWLLAVLTEREALLSQAERIAHLGSWCWDLRASRFTWSEELFRLLGLDPDRDRASMESFLAMVHEDDREALRLVTERVTSPDVESRHQCRIRRRDGAVREVVLDAVRLRDDAGSVVRVVGVVQDTTELREMERQVVQAEKLEALGRLAGGLAHDLNNLLTTIACNVHLLRSSGTPAELDEIASATARAGAMVRQLQGFSRTRVRQPELLDVDAILDAATEPIRRLAGGDVAVELVRAEKALHVVADEQELRQALLCVAVNARDAMPEGGRLVMRAYEAQLDDSAARRMPGAKPGPHAVVEVTDTGCGMDEATKSRAFEPFFTTKSGARRTGLGLSSVLGLMMATGGSVSLESAPGRGTTLRLHFPLGPPPSAPAVQEAPEPQAPARRGTILLVEDDGSVRQVLLQLLSGAGYEVVSAGDAAQALRIATSRETPFDLLLTDIHLPGLDGRELARLLREQGRASATLFLTGWAAEASRLLPESSEGRLLHKPVAPETLHRAVERAMAPRTG